MKTYKPPRFPRWQTLLPTRQGPGAYELGPVTIVKQPELPGWRAWIWYSRSDPTIHSDGDATLKEAIFSAREWIKDQDPR